MAQQKQLSFAGEIHVDLSDGIFAPQLLSYTSAFQHLPVKFSLHLMFQKAEDPVFAMLQLKLKPRVVILQAEATDFEDCALKLKAAKVPVGACLLQESKPSDFQAKIKLSDEVMIFSGSLGKQGGKLDLNLKSKIAEVKKINPAAKISWDGGINSSNLPELKKAAVEVFYVGASIAKAADPRKAYQELQDLDS